MRAIYLLPFFLSLQLFCQNRKNEKFSLHFIVENLKSIPAGSFRSGEDEVDVPNPKRSFIVRVKSFYMFNQEVSNGLYRWYLNEVNKGDSALDQKLLPDTLVWRDKFAYNEPYVEYYFRHPAYKDYPLVGISYEQCELFCNWLTEKYNADPKRKFKKVLFSLPDSAQREFAAMGGLKEAVYPWGGPCLQNRKGEWLANFLVLDQSSAMRREFEVDGLYGKEKKVINMAYGGCGCQGPISDNADITAPVTSYKPNVYGLYNLSGNVEEFIRPKGSTMGGSWRDPGYYLQNSVIEKYDSQHETSSERGFRFIMMVMEEFPK